jgi:ABC-type nitrate/sulfonate/bicarbonate transport system permease component
VTLAISTNDQTKGKASVTDGAERPSLTGRWPRKRVTSLAVHSIANSAGALDRRVILMRLITAILVFGSWEAAERLGFLDPFFASSPSLIAQKLIVMVADGSIWPHVAASASVVGLGFTLAVVVGVPLGLALGRSELLRGTMEPYIAAIYASPTVAFLPLIIIWLGIGLLSKVALVFLGSFVIVIVNTEAGVAQVDRRLVETARSFCATERQILRWIILPSAVPFILLGMRLAAGRALLMVVVAEIYASNAGLGYLIFQAGGFYDTSQVFVGVLILAAAGVSLNAALRALERRLAPWRSDIQ